MLHSLTTPYIQKTPSQTTQRLMIREFCSASYRDLLDTAESIISMDSQMHDVEALMGELGRRCNTRALEKKGSNLRTWSKEVEASSTRTP